MAPLLPPPPPQSTFGSVCVEVSNVHMGLALAQHRRLAAAQEAAAAAAEARSSPSSSTPAKAPGPLEAPRLSALVLKQLASSIEHVDEAIDIRYARARARTHTHTHIHTHTHSHTHTRAHCTLHVAVAHRPLLCPPTHPPARPPT